MSRSMGSQRFGRLFRQPGQIAGRVVNVVAPRVLAASRIWQDGALCRARAGQAGARRVRIEFVIARSEATKQSWGRRVAFYGLLDCFPLAALGVAMTAGFPSECVTLRRRLNASCFRDAAQAMRFSAIRVLRP